MKQTILQPTTTVAGDQAQLAHVILQAAKNGYPHVFSPHPVAWRADNCFQYIVTNSGEYTWINSRGKEVVVFLLSGTTCSGYRICEFEPRLS